MIGAEVRRIRVVVAADHPSVRENLRYLVNAETDLECVGVAKHAGQCLEACGQLAPDVLVMDGEMPGLDGPAVVGVLAETLPSVRVVVYTLDGEKCDAARAAGAVECVIKDAPYEMLVRAIRQAGSGSEMKARA